MKNIYALLFIFLPCLYGSAQRHTANGPTPTCAPTDSTLTQAICQGDTLYFGTDTLTQSGTYTDTLNNAGGCDSVVTLVLTVNALPVVTLSWDSMVANGEFIVNLSPTRTDTGTCSDYEPFYSALKGGHPYGGYYAGLGVSNDTLWLSSFTGGVDTITYLYTDTNGCTAKATDPAVIDICYGITTIPTANLFTLSPNPADDHVMIDFDAAYTGSTIYIKDITGRQLLQTKLTGTPQQISTGNLPPGIYTVTMFYNGQIGARLLVKE